MFLAGYSGRKVRDVENYGDAVCPSYDVQNVVIQVDGGGNPLRMPDAISTRPAKLGNLRLGMMGFSISLGLVSPSDLTTGLRDSGPGPSYQTLPHSNCLVKKC